MHISYSQVSLDNEAVCHVHDDEPRKHNICRGVDIPLDKYTRSSLFHLLLMVYVDNSYSIVLFVINSNLYYAIFLILKDVIRFFYLAQWKTMGNERGCVNLAFCNKIKHFLAVASIHTSCLER